MTAYNLDLKDKNFFPIFAQLPYDLDYDTDFFKEDRWSGNLRPRHHWCFLVEITKVVLWIRPVYYGKDANGDTVFLAFHTDDRSPHIALECEVGDTLAIMYAESHTFGDGNIGVRIELNEHVKLFHHSLKTILSVGEALNATSCHVCNKPANSQCVKCAMKYCSKDCQTADWKHKHKSECSIGKSIRQWKSFDWCKFDHYRTL